MSLTVIEGARLAAGARRRRGPLGRAPPPTLLVVPPAAFLFASVMVAIGAMARSFKEAQTLLTPVYFLCFTPSLIGGAGRLPAGGAGGARAGHRTSRCSRATCRSARRTLGADGRSSSRARSASARLALALAAPPLRLRAAAGRDDAGLGLRAWLRHLLSAPRRRAPPSRPPRRRPPGHALALFGVAFVLLCFVFVPCSSWRLVPGLALSEWVGLLGLDRACTRAAAAAGSRAVLRLRMPSARRCGRGPDRLVGLDRRRPAGRLGVAAPKELVEKLRRVITPARGGRGAVALRCC